MRGRRRHATMLRGAAKNLQKLPRDDDVSRRHGVEGGTHELGIEQCDDAARAADAVQTATYSGREGAEAAIFA
jgi:hypothetical protein